MNEKLPNIAIIGLGLIGSSIALAAKHAGAAAVSYTHLRAHET